MKIIFTKEQARKLWIQAQKLNEREPFSRGPDAVKTVVEHLGYVQIDTINVIERSHHHILFTRLPHYRHQDLVRAQSIDKSIFEYWTHALSYVPTRDLKYYIKDMNDEARSPSSWFKSVKKDELRKVLRLIKRNGPLSIRDIEDDVLVEKDHPWASRKPSKRALQFAFFRGDTTVCERMGMTKKYELIDRHFQWKKRPRPTSEKERLEYIFERAIRSHGVVSLDSICYLAAELKTKMGALIDKKVKKAELVCVEIEDLSKTQFWVKPQALDMKSEIDDGLTHLLSPFDPLVIQRKRVNMLFGYEHRFEAYFPKEKRILGYFALPVLMGDKIVAAIDLKTDRAQKKLIMQKWTWLEKHKSKARKIKIEEELNRFEKFQLSSVKK